MKDLKNLAISVLHVSDIDNYGPLKNYLKKSLKWSLTNQRMSRNILGRNIGRFTKMVLMILRIKKLVLTKVILLLY